MSLRYFVRYLDWRSYQHRLILNFLNQDCVKKFGAIQLQEIDDRSLRQLPLWRCRPKPQINFDGDRSLRVSLKQYLDMAHDGRIDPVLD